MPSNPESRGRARYDGHKRWKGLKVHMVVEILGHLLALHATPANQPERALLAALAESMQEVTDEGVQIAFVDQG